MYVCLMIKNISKTVKKPKVVKKLGKKRKASCAHVIVLGNEKGGSGKSTLAMHLIIGFLSEGKRVASVDCDARQGSLTRYILNRNKFNKKANGEYLLPNHFPLDPIGIETPDNAEIEKLQEKLSLLIEGALLNYDIILIDTPGSANQVSLLAHSYADTLITPMNDSFIDLDVIAHIDGYDMSVKGPSHYAELIWDARKMKADRDGGAALGDPRRRREEERAEDREAVPQGGQVAAQAPRRVGAARRQAVPRRAAEGDRLRAQVEGGGGLRAQDGGDGRRRNRDGRQPCWSWTHAAAVGVAADAAGCARPASRYA